MAQGGKVTEALTVYKALKDDETKIAGWVPREWARDANDRQRILGEVLRHANMQCSEHFQGPISAATADSIFLAVVTFCQARVIPNKALGLGYFIPYKGIVQPVFGYKGLLQAVRREAGVLTSEAQIVLEGDGWNLDVPWYERWRTFEPGPQHTPLAPAEKWVAGFSRFRWESGFEDVFLMPGQELRDRRTRALGGKIKGPWFDWPVSMAQKTLIRRHITSGRVEMAGDGFVAIADGLSEGGRMRELAMALAARESAALDSDRCALVDKAVDVDPDLESKPARGSKAVADKLRQRQAEDAELDTFAAREEQ
jgi:hypothetical protein